MVTVAMAVEEVTAAADVPAAQGTPLVGDMQRRLQANAPPAALARRTNGAMVTGPTACEVASWDGGGLVPEEHMSQPRLPIPRIPLMFRAA
jgi:hypothetical protein